jgi:hypothetical protein
MTVDERPLKGPDEARRVMDALEATIEATIEAEATTPASPGGGERHDDWVPEVPGSGEPPD